MAPASRTDARRLTQKRSFRGGNVRIMRHPRPVEALASVDDPTGLVAAFGRAIVGCRGARSGSNPVVRGVLAAIVGAFALVPTGSEAATGPARHRDALAGSPTVGTCHEGSLPGGVELPARTSTMQRLSVVRERGTGFGSPRLVAFVLRTAQRLAALPEQAGVVLRVGNLSLQGGGDMKWSHSHTAGRDVDFPLYAVDAAGKPTSPDGFVHFDEHGNGRYRRRKVRFDVARNWNLVATLLTDPSVDVAHLYLAEPLRRVILAHAEQQGADPSLLDRARQVLEEPSHAGRHDDHLHVRLLCSAEEIAGGCVDEDPRWPWASDVREALRARVDRAALALTDRRWRIRAAAIGVLEPWAPFDDEACRALAWAAGYDKRGSLRAQALSALRPGKAACATAALLGAARAERTPAKALPLLRRAVQLADHDDGAALRGLLADQPEGFRFAWPATLRSEIRASVARRLAERPDPAALAALQRALDDPDARARRTARHALEVLANRRLADGDAALGWSRSQQRLQPLRWLLDGFEAVGLPVQAPAASLGPALVELLRGPDPVLADNAERLLVHLTGGVRLGYLPTPRHRHRAWSRFWALHGARYADREIRLEPELAAGPRGGDRRAILQAHVAE